MAALRQRLAVSAILASSLTVAVASGCSSSSSPVVPARGTESAPVSGTSQSSSSSPPPAAAVFKVGALLVSDGTSTVTVGGEKFAFPTTVTDAAWSPDGSRIAFIDADGNVDSAHPDGTGRLVLTKRTAGETLTAPAWRGDHILYTHRAASGALMVERVAADGIATPGDAGQPAVGGPGAPTGANCAADASTALLTNGARGETAFQHQGAHGPEVWIMDEYQRDATTVKLADGSQPAVSPDGTQVAYVGADGQIHLGPSTIPYGKTAQTTTASSGLSAPTHLTWTPDGQRIAFSTASDIESIAAHPAGGAHANAPTIVSNTRGVATYLRASTDRLERLASADPIASAIAVSQARWQSTTTYRVMQSDSYAYGATLANPADPMAAALGAVGDPILYTGAGALDPRTKAELKRILGAPSQGQIPTVTIVGDTSMVSAAVENAVKQLGYKTERISGADAYAVNAAAPRDGMSAGSEEARLILVGGDDPAAVAAASYAGQYSVMLTRGRTLPPAAASYLAAMVPGGKVYVVGSEAQQALGSWSKRGVQVIPLVGSDAAQDSVLLAQWLASYIPGYIVVDPQATPDAAVALSATWQLGYPVLLVDPGKGLENATSSYLDDASASVDSLVVVGPAGSIPDTLAQQAATRLSGPLGFTPAQLSYVAR